MISSGQLEVLVWPVVWMGMGKRRLVGGWVAFGQGWVAVHLPSCHFLPSRSHHVIASLRQRTLAAECRRMCGSLKRRKLSRFGWLWRGASLFPLLAGGELGDVLMRISYQVPKNRRGAQEEREQRKHVMGLPRLGVFKYMC